LLEKRILQEDTGKPHSFNQLNAVIDSYPHIICKLCLKAQHKPRPVPAFLSDEGSWGCIAHISR